MAHMKRMIVDRLWCFAYPDFRFATTLEYPVLLVPQEGIMRRRRRWIRSIISYTPLASMACDRFCVDNKDYFIKKYILWFVIEGFSFYSISIVRNVSLAVGLSLASLFSSSFSPAPLGMVGATILARGTR